MTISAEAFFKQRVVDTADRSVMTQSEIVKTIVALEDAARLEKTERLRAMRLAKMRDQ